MSLSILVHLPFNLHCSCQPDYYCILSCSLARHFRARLLSVSRSEFLYGWSIKDLWKKLTIFLWNTPGNPKGAGFSSFCSPMELSHSHSHIVPFEASLRFLQIIPANANLLHPLQYCPPPCCLWKPPFPSTIWTPCQCSSCMRCVLFS